MQFKHLVISALIAGTSLLSINASADTDIQPKVIGGCDSKETYPWMVSVTQREGNGLYHNCGGALIDKDWVLTAAHCIDDANVSDTYLVIGTRDFLNNVAEPIQAEEFVIHENYELSNVHVDNDIALIKLSESSSNATISLANTLQTDSLEEDTLLTLIGWGSTIFEPEPDEIEDAYPSTLQIVDIPLRTEAQCAELYSGTDSDILCAGAHAGGVDACDGDSGGPLFIKQGNEYLHLGLVSYADGCALEGKYGVYTKTAAYLDWVSNQIPTLATNPSTASLTSASPSCETTNNSSGGGSSGGSLNWLFIASLALLAFRPRRTQ